MGAHLRHSDRSGQVRSYAPGRQHAGQRLPMHDQLVERPEDRSRGARALRHAGRGARFFMLALLPFAVLLLLGLGLAYVRLQHGPISLSFLVPPIERAISSALGNHVARVEDAIVRLTDQNRLEFRLKNVRFSEADGDIVASSPLAAIEISRKGLMQGMLVPSRVVLIKPELFLSYAPDKGVGLSFSALPVSAPVDGAQPRAPVAADAQVPSPSPATSPSSSELRVPAPRPAGKADADPAVAEVERNVALLKKIDFGTLLKRATSEARAPGSAASYLREFGVSDAVLHVESRGHRTTWRLPEFSIDLGHGEARSIISGSARVSAGVQSWRVSFHTEEDEQLRLRAAIRDLVPAMLFAGDEQHTLLAGLDMPVDADAVVTLNPGGETQAIDLDIGMGRGNILHRDGTGQLQPVPFEAGRVKVGYDVAKGQLVLAPSKLHAADMAVTLRGEARRGSIDGIDAWGFSLISDEGRLGAVGTGVAPVALKSLAARGHFIPESEQLNIEVAELEAGDARFTASGDMRLGHDRPGVSLKASAAPMSVATLKSIWPAGVAARARAWVQANVLGGSIKSLEMSRQSGSFALRADGGSAERSSLVAEVGEGSFRASSKLPPVSFPRALIGIENGRLEISAPDAVMALGSGRAIRLRGAQLVAAEVESARPSAELSFKAEADMASAIALLHQPPLSVLGERELPFKSAEGKLEAQLAMKFPLLEDLNAADVTTTGKAKLSDGRIQKLFGDYDVQGTTVGFDFTEGAIEAKGEAIVRGVLAKIAWQHIRDAPPERQPPLRITATLDNTDRRQLGLDLDHILLGTVPVDLQVVRGASPAEQKLHVRADLANAEMMLTGIAWRKPPGRAAFAEFDIAQSPQGRTELQNFRVAGDNIAIEGWVALGPDRKLKEFLFPVFSLNVVTSLKLQGNVRSDGILDLKARGATFDGKDFFRSLFAVARPAEEIAAKAGAGVDLDAEIDNMLGYSEVSLRSLKAKVQTRRGKLTGLDARGTLDGGAPLAAVLDLDEKGQRRIRADSTDAGQAFKLVGFYPNMQKGRVRIEVNADGRGAAEKTGTLWVEDFRVLGDPVVAEVVSSGLDDTRPKIGGGKRVVREVFEFDIMRVPFSVGHGQFVLDDAYMKGPLIGATIRGKVDYKAEKVNIGGTYIPLQGLNNAFGQIPVLGQILSGPRGEGIFGITFAIQGAMANPQVIVNPLSLVAPGIFREVFQMTNPSPKVQPRASETIKKKRGTRGQDAPAVAPGTTIDGWSSETKQK